MQLPVYHVDAFTDRPFHGNPAAVVPLAGWMRDETLQAIAGELCLPITAFVAPSGPDYHVRWFTPRMEMDLCGHATLAAAHVIFRDLQPQARSLTFQSMSGPLMVTREEDLLSLFFPARPAKAAKAPEGLFEALGCAPGEVFRGQRDLMVVLEDEAALRALKPNFPALAQVDAWAVLVTAPGREVDFVSRFFAPKQGLPEDPVTGSAHCTLGPYWAKRLDKTKLDARQLSERGGELHVEVQGRTVIISGRCVQIMAGTMVL